MTTPTQAPAGTVADGLDASDLTAALTMKDLHKSLAWYRDVFGFAVVQEFKSPDGELRGVALQAGSVRILINQDDGAKGWDRIKGQGFALQVTTSKNIDEVAQRIKDAGGTLAMEPADMPWGARIFRLVDLDGFHWSVSTPWR